MSQQIEISGKGMISAVTADLRLKDCLIDSNSLMIWKAIPPKLFEEEKAKSAVIYSKPVKIKSLSPKSTKDAILSKAPSLATLKKYIGEVKCNAVLHFLIYEMSDCFNVGKGLKAL